MDQSASNINSYISHQIRTPLLGILGYTGILREEIEILSESEIKEIIFRIEESGKKLHRITEKLLLVNDLSFSINNKTNFVPLGSTTNNADEVIKNEANEIVKKNGRYEDLKLDLTPITLNIYEDHLRFIVNEIIENAVKFSASENTICLKSYIQKNYYVLEIKDKGRGIPAEQVKNISDSINSSDFIVGVNGNGLGLIVTGKLLKAYNGKLEIESQQNSYTKIRLHFERQKPGDN